MRNGRWAWLPGLLASLALTLPLNATARPEAAAFGPPLAGWFEVFPALAGYQRSFQAPVFRPTRRGIYRQTARYAWTGDADRAWDVTLARDPAFARRYATAALGALSPPPRPVRVAGRVAWLWDLPREGSCQRDQVRHRLVVILASDKVLSFDGTGLGPWDNAVALAGFVDLARATAALDGPPRIDPRRILRDFMALTKGVSYDDVVAWVGVADADIGSGIHVLEYKLGDGSRVLLGFPDYHHLLYVTHIRRDGAVDDLVR